MKYKEHTAILDSDEKNLFDILIAGGLQKVLFMALDDENFDFDGFLLLCIEIQCLLTKLGYDFKINLEEEIK